jgi:hypothetical protein
MPRDVMLKQDIRQFASSVSRKWISNADFSFLVDRKQTANFPAQPLYADWAQITSCSNKLVWNTATGDFLVRKPGGQCNKCIGNEDEIINQSNIYIWQQDSAHTDTRYVKLYRTLHVFLSPIQKRKDSRYRTVTLPVALYGYLTWSLTRSQKYRSTV